MVFVLKCFVLCPSLTMPISFARFEVKQSAKVAAGPSLEIRGRSFFVASLNAGGH